MITDTYHFTTMSKYNIFLLLLLSFHYKLPTAKSDSTDFIKGECRATLYPVLCIQCLSSYSNTVQNSSKQLAQASLSVSISRAQSVSTFISKLARMRGLKPTEHQAVEDCIANMANAVDQLSLSVKELGGMTTRGFSNWHESNIESWVGAALTFEKTCLDGFTSLVNDGNVKDTVTKRVVDCTQVTSNALVLVHRYAAARHKDSASLESTNLP